MVIHMHSRTERISTRQLLILLGMCLVLLVGVSFSGLNRPFVSSEVAFTDASASGLSIVPASCPSYPHYAGECSPGGGGSGGAGSAVSVTATGNSCVLALNRNTISSGGSAMLSWSANYSIFGIPYSVNGTITATPNTSGAPGAVGSTGSYQVNPTVTTTYNGTFTPTGTTGIPEIWLTPIQCNPTQLNVVAANVGPTQCTLQTYCVGADRYQQSTSCANTFLGTCQYGCSNGTCLGPGAPTAFIRVRPALVASGTSTTVEWSASLVSSCTVTENNPGFTDSWTGASGAQLSSPITSQVIYTLSCAGLNGTSISRTATVNIAPTFDEN